MKVEAHEAMVKTASVQIKALTVNGKQMTLAVFRQLEYGNLIDRETGEIYGVPWGRVNYFWGECADDSADPHFHVVWQQGEELRRACVYDPAEYRYRYAPKNRTARELMKVSYAEIAATPQLFIAV